MVGKLAGEREYIERFTVARNGDILGVTSAYRLIRIDRDGRIRNIVTVY